MDAQTKKIEVGAGSRGNLNKPGQMKTDCFSTRRGCRADGAGRKDHLKAYKRMMKSWVETERANGHSLNATDLQLQWVWFADEARKALEARREELKPDAKFPGSSIGTIIKIGAGRPRTAIFDSGFGSTRRAVRLHPNRSSEAAVQWIPP